MSELNVSEQSPEEEEVKADPRTFKGDLYQAAKENDTQKILGFLSTGVPPTFVDPNSSLTALHWAAVYGNSIIIKSLLESGASALYHKQKAKSLILNGKDIDDKKSKFNYSTSHRSDESNEQQQQQQQSTDENISPTSLNPNSSELLMGDDDIAEEMRLESTYDFTKNTPLLWSACKGYLYPLWLLLQDGYSSNDIDNLGNNSLHLAAANGNLKVVKSLINDGANPNVVNIYKNVPIDMAISKDVREAIAVAMEKNASMTSDDMRNMHKQNVKMYTGLVQSLQEAINDASKLDSPRINRQGLNIPDMMRNLEGAIRISKDWALDEALILQAETLLTKMEVTQDLVSEIASLQKLMPISTQADYIEAVSKLEKTVLRAESLGSDKVQILFAKELISKCQIEFWLTTMNYRLKDVTRAADANEHDINRLKQAIQKAQALRSDDELIDKSVRLHGRLTAELLMSRGLLGIPTVRLPPPVTAAAATVDNSLPVGYWQECDIGMIIETEGYPLPPVDNNGEYQWQPSESYSNMKTAIERLRSSMQGAESFGANPAVIADSKEKLAKSDKEFKQLEAKDAADKALAIEVATKLAKKLKKGKKSPKKK